MFPGKCNVGCYSYFAVMEPTFLPLTEQENCRADWIEISTSKLISWYWLLSGDRLALNSFLGTLDRSIVRTTTENTPYYMLAQEQYGQLCSYFVIGMLRGLIGVRRDKFYSVCSRLVGPELRIKGHRCVWSPSGTCKILTFAEQPAGLISSPLFTGVPVDVGVGFPMLSTLERRSSRYAIVSATLPVLDNSLLWLLCFQTDSDCPSRDRGPIVLHVSANQRSNSVNAYG